MQANVHDIETKEKITKVNHTYVEKEELFNKTYWLAKAPYSLYYVTIYNENFEFVLDIKSLYKYNTNSISVLDDVCLTALLIKLINT